MSYFVASSELDGEGPHPPWKPMICSVESIHSCNLTGSFCHQPSRQSTMFPLCRGGNLSSDVTCLGDLWLVAELGSVPRCPNFFLRLPWLPPLPLPSHSYREELETEVKPGSPELFLWLLGWGLPKLRRKGRERERWPRILGVAVGMSRPGGSLKTIWDLGGRKIQPSKNQRPREGQESPEA